MHRPSRRTTPRGSLRAGGWLFVGLVGSMGLLGCGDDPPPPSPPPPPIETSASDAAEPFDDSETFVRLPAGTVLRDGPTSSDRALRVLEADASLRVIAQRDGAFHVELDAVSTAWARSADAKTVRVLPPALGPRPSVAAADDDVAAIRRHMSGPVRTLRAGPYTLVTDVRDDGLIATLDALLSVLDAQFEQRIGVVPRGPARETILLFAQRRDFRAFEAADPDARSGYAGHARGAEGLVVLHADRPRDQVLTTVVHEAAHLVARRSLGAPLPRWLSEGLADALGDSASDGGYRPLRGSEGAEGIVKRLRLAYDHDQAGSVAALMARDADFDRSHGGRPSYDYEQSALLVRFLLTDPDLSPRFRSHLTHLAGGGRHSTRGLLHRLGVDANGMDAESLDQRFSAWVRSLP